MVDAVAFEERSNMRLIERFYVFRGNPNTFLLYYMNNNSWTIWRDMNTKHKHIGEITTVILLLCAMYGVVYGIYYGNVTVGVIGYFFMLLGVGCDAYYQMKSN